MKRLADEMREHLDKKLIPFWRSMRDEQYGGYFTSVDYSLITDEDAQKNILSHCGILGFFSTAALVLNEDSYLDDARAAYEFITKYFIDRENGGVYFSISREGDKSDVSKLTYAHAYAISALTSYYQASADPAALELALKLFDTVEEKCRCGLGYYDFLSEGFSPLINVHFSENGVMAYYTVNTALMLAYTYAKLFEASGEETVRASLVKLLSTFTDRMFNSFTGHLDQFFDMDMNPISRNPSYGHEAQAAWILDSAAVALTTNDSSHQYDYLVSKCSEICQTLAKNIYDELRDGGLKDNIDGDDEYRWWVQAHGLLAMANAYLTTLDEKYLKAAYEVWDFIQDNIIDNRMGGEWYHDMRDDGTHTESDVANRWKGPEHNGMMCLSIIEWQGACDVLEQYAPADNGISFTIDPQQHHHHCDDDDCEE